MTSTPPIQSAEPNQEKNKKILERVGIRREDIESDLRQIHSAEIIRGALILSRKKANRESAVALLVLNQVKDHFPKLDSGRKVMLSWRTWTRQVLKRNRYKLSITEVITEAQKEFETRAKVVENDHGISNNLAKVILAIIGAETLSLQPNQKMARATTAKDFAKAWMECILNKPRGPKISTMLKLKMTLPIDEQMLARYHNGHESKTFVRTRVATGLQKLKDSPGDLPKRELSLAMAAASQLKLLVEIRKDLWEGANHPDFRALQYPENFSTQPNKSTVHIGPRTYGNIAVALGKTEKI